MASLTNKKCLIGPSVSIKEGPFTAVRYSHYLGGNVSQFYLGSNQSSKMEAKSKKFTAEEIVKTKKFCKIHNHHIMVHGVLPMNLSAKPNSIKYIHQNVAYDLNIVEQIGGIGVVLHLGKQLDGQSREEAYKNMAVNVERILDLAEKNAPHTKIILETGAGNKKGSQIATTLEEFAELWNLIPKTYHKRLGICVDTAHIFTAGYDIRSIDGVKSFFKLFDKLLGMKNLVCLHINDSNAEYNSKVDRHIGINEGYIFNKEKGGSMDALYEIYKIATEHQIPMALETHKSGFADNEDDAGQYGQEVQLFRKWDDGKKVLNFKLEPIDIEILKNKFINYLASENIEYTSKHQVGTGISKDIETKHPDNSKMVSIFDRLRIAYQAKKDFIRGNSYKRVVYQLKQYPEKITKGSQVSDIKGIGPKIIEKIDEILESGKLKLLENLEADLPESTGYQEVSDDENISNIFGFGPKAVEKLENSGINTMTLLKKAISEEKIKLTPSQLIGVKFHQDLEKRIPRNEAKAIFDKVKKIITEYTRFSDLEVHIAGSYPSGKATSKDIDILITSKTFKNKDDLKNNDILKNIVKLLTMVDIVKHTLSVGDTKFLGLVQLKEKSVYRHMDIRLVPKSVFPFAYFHYTSGGEFNKLIREIAKSKGYKLSEWGISISDTKKAKYTEEELVKLVKKIKNDKDIFKLLETDYVSQEDRR